MQDSMTVKIKNYQIIRNATLEFIPGLNVIVGQSNNGKSAILRAIETALFNIPRTTHVTQGETVSAVGIQYKGQQLIWRRDTKAASQVSYKWNGNTLTKLGRGQPEFIAQALGIKEMDLDGELMRLNFQKQMSYPFLLDKTPSQLFKFIVQSAEEDNLMEVLDAMKKDLTQIASSIKANERAQEEVGKSYNSERKKYMDVKDSLPLCEFIITDESRIKSYLRLSTIVDTLKEDINNKSGIISNISIIETKLATIEPNSQSAMRDIATLTSLCSLVESIEAKKHDKSQVSSRLEDVKSKLEKYDSLSEVQLILDGIQSRKAQAESINKPTNLLSKAYGDRESVKEHMVTLDTELDSLKQVSKYSLTLVKIEDLTQILNQLIEVSDARSTCLSNLDSTTISITEVLKELTENFPTCPYCGSTLDGNHIHN